MDLPALKGFDQAPTELIAVIGAGGHANSILSLIQELKNYKVLGFFDDFRDNGKSFHPDFRVLGSYRDAFTKEFKHSSIAVGIGHPLVKRSELFNAGLNSGKTVPVLRHPNALIDSRVQIGLGTQLHIGCIVRSGSIIEENVIINTGAVVDHDNRIGAHSSISPSATLCGSVTIGQYCFVGAGAVILPGITVGEKSIIGAGAVVIKDVPESTLCIGNPGRIVSIGEKSRNLIGEFL